MNDTIRNEIEELKTLNLTELRARFAEVIGEPTKAVNKAHLVRRITEALEARAAETPAQDSVVEALPDESTPAETEPTQAAPTPAQAAPAGPVGEEPEFLDEAPDAADSSQESTPDEPAAEPSWPATKVAPKLSKMDVDALRKRYVEVVGRKTGSREKSYLIWKIRQVEKGKVPVGSRESRRSSAEPQDIKVLPLRLEADLVEQLDQARERLGLKSRMDLFRRALHSFLLEAGEVRVAELFAPYTTEA
jgi:hypothetical protein